MASPAGLGWTSRTEPEAELPTYAPAEGGPVPWAQHGAVAPGKPYLQRHLFPYETKQKSTPG
jgi:hypothetical protein